MKIKTINKASGILVLFLLLVSPVSAFFPATYEANFVNQFSEICPVKYECNIFCKLIPFIKPQKVNICNSRELAKNFNAHPFEYNYSNNLIRMCYRSCWEKDLEFLSSDFIPFYGQNCWCQDEDKLPIETPIDSPMQKQEVLE